MIGNVTTKKIFARKILVADFAAEAASKRMVLNMPHQVLRSRVRTPAIPTCVNVAGPVALAGRGSGGGSGSGRD